MFIAERAKICHETQLYALREIFVCLAATWVVTSHSNTRATKNFHAL
jgi:hypothetical protein